MGRAPEAGRIVSPKVGIDTGGTFTDFVRLDGSGRIQVRKELSTPHDPSGAILLGLERMEVDREAAIVHGSTVATNALLERRGARTALVTTAGFGDVLAIGRQDRSELYALVPRNPEPLVPSTWRFEVKERVAADGAVIEPLEAKSLMQVVEKVAAEQVESVAVCLLFSFLHPEHERQIRAAILARLQDRRPIHISHGGEPVWEVIA